MNVHIVHDGLPCPRCGESVSESASCETDVPWDGYRMLRQIERSVKPVGS